MGGARRRHPGDGDRRWGARYAQPRDRHVRGTSPLPVAEPQQALRAGEWVGLGGNASLASAKAPFRLPSGAASLTGGDFVAHPSVFEFTSDAGNAQRTYAPRSFHATPERAAVRALQFYNPLSIEENSEFAGSICRRTDSMFFANIPAENIEFSDSVQPTLCVGTQGVQSGLLSHPR